MDSVISFVTSAAKLIVAVGLAYVAALWFALIVWTYRDIETRSRSVVTQIFATLLVVLFFVPGAILYYVLRPRETLDEAFQRSLEEEYLLQDLEDLPRCHKCHRGIESDWVVCPSCHTELRHECSNCKHLVRVTWDICPYCATELEPEAAVEDENSSIGRLTAMIRDRFGDRLNGEAKPGEPVFPNAAPEGASGLPPSYAQPIPLQQYVQQQSQHVRTPAAGQQGNNSPPMIPFTVPDSPLPGQAAPSVPEIRPNRPAASPHTETLTATSPRAPGDPYHTDVPLDFEDLKPIHVEGGSGNGNGVAVGRDKSNGATNGQFANGPTPNGHVAAANGSNGFHPNGNGNVVIPGNPPGHGNGIPGFGPPPQGAASEQGRPLGEPVGPPAAPVRRP